jgi:hypothetical protein
MSEQGMDIPTRFRAVCEFCQGRYGPVDTRADGTHQFTCGWVMQREGGGGHGVSLPVRDPTRWAHRQCVEEEVRGNSGQRSLFREEAR